MEVDAARAKFAPEREGKYKKQAINSAWISHIIVLSHLASTLNMVSDDESDKYNGSRRPSTTSTAGSFNNVESDSTYANNGGTSRRNTTTSPPPVRSSYENDDEDSFLSGYHAEDEEEESVEGQWSGLFGL